MEAKREMESLLTTEEVAKVFACSGRQVRYLHTRGTLPAVRFPGCTQLRFTPEAVRRLLEQSETTKAA